MTWGSGAVEGNYQDWSSRVQEAVREHTARERLAGWLTREHCRLGIEVTFWISAKHESDLDNLFDTILNPLVDGACPEVPRQGRRRLDGRFLTALVHKIITSGEPRTVILVYPTGDRRPKEAILA